MAVSCVLSAILPTGRAGRAYQYQGSGGIGGQEASPPPPLRVERGVKCYVCLEHPAHILAVVVLNDLYRFFASSNPIFALS